MDSYYDIYSSGELVNDANPAETSAALARLFKTSEDKIAHLIAGKPQLIKRRVEKTEALRYKATLHQAGLLVSVKLSESAPEAMSASTAISQTTESTPATPDQKNPVQTAQVQTSHYDFTIAPAGSEILHADEKQLTEARVIDTSAIKLAPVSFMTETATAPSTPAPDTSHLSLAEVGSILGNSDDQPPLPAPDISHISVAEVGAPLDELKPAVILLNPDTSRLSIAETGVDLIPAEYHKPAPPPPPMTDHIKLQTD
jgi:hypothetical protein